MADHQHNRPHPGNRNDFVEHARYRAGHSPSGIGAAVARSGFGRGGHTWECIVSDGQTHRYVSLIAPSLGPRPNVSAPALESAIESFAAEFPQEARLRALVQANPLHLDDSGTVGN